VLQVGLDTIRSVCNTCPMSTPVLIRAKITPAEWTRIRKRALDAGVPTSQWVALALRDALLKGAKP